MFRTVRGPLAPDVSFVGAVSVFEWAVNPVAKKMERNLNLMHVIILGFAILSLIFLISGFATRGWIIYEMTIVTNPGEVPYHDWQQHPEQKANLKFSITFGLWKGKACVMSKCTDLSYSQTAGIIFYDKGKTANMSWQEICVAA